MLYSKYKVIYYCKRGSLKTPVKEYLDKLPIKEKAKAQRYIDLLWKSEGKLQKPFIKHIHGKVWELRIKYENLNHRIFYFVASNCTIVLLSAFLKKSRKTPKEEIKKAYLYYLDYLSSISI